MIEIFELLPGVTLRCFPDHRFKQGCLSVQLIRPMCREEAALNALIPAVLLRGCRNSPDLRHITLRLDDLYGAAVGTMVRRVGDYQTTGLCCSFMEDRFAMTGDRILAPMIRFLEELLLEPVTEKGLFQESYIRSEKKNLLCAIEAQRNDKRTYASARMLRLMCRKDSFGIPRLGESEQVRAITPASAWAHYRKILRTSPVELFYVGSAPGETVAALLRPMFQRLNRQYTPLPPQLPYQQSDPVEGSETMDVTQGKLCMGFYTPITLRHPDFAAMQVCNTLLGGGMSNKLFNTVREQLSLCYDIGSGYHGSKGILTVAAGIDFDKYETVKAQILHQVDACRQGQITAGELENAKQALICQLRATHDSPGAIEGYYGVAAISGLELTPEAYIRAVASVTVEQAARAAGTLRPHTVFFLKGVR